MPYLLDANVLIALAIAEHEHHQRAATWASGQQQFAICPLVEGALTRFIVRLGGSHSVATQILRGFLDDPRVEFWPDGLSYVDVDLRHVTGHRQVTDAYLISLAESRSGWNLATFDRALVQTWPAIGVLIP